MSLSPANLLILMSDQHNRSMMGCVGHPVVRTPNLDALAARGTVFPNAYCNSPICVPSRASMATGRYPHQIRSWDNAFPYEGAPASWGHRLAAEGHRVVTVGKLHFRSVDDATGFSDQRLAMHVHEGVGDLFSLLRTDMEVRRDVHDLLLRPTPGESAYAQYDEAITLEARGILTDEAPGWDEPWVLVVSFTLPHHPLVAPQAYADMYPPESVVFPSQYRMADRPMHPAIEELRRVFGLDSEADELTVRRAVAMYYAMCTLLDERCGQVLEALGEAGLTDSTRVIYTSDHGDSVGEHGLWMKHTMYEGSVGVPFIVAGPGVPEDRQSDSNVSLVDCYPSILDCVGVKHSKDDEDLPGRSVFEMLDSRQDVERSVFGEYHAEGSENGVFMIRGSRYKYIEYVYAPPQLFDLATDPGETNDLAGSPDMAAILASCAAELRTIGDPIEIDRLAHDDQRQRIEAHGGEAAIRAAGYAVPFTAPPSVSEEPREPR